MEMFFIPREKTKFISWLLQESNNKEWTIVFEYSSDDTYRFLREIGTEVSLPINSTYHYDPKYKLTAIKKTSINDETITKITSITHVLSVYNKEEMQFLIADDFHEECFSCSLKFYNSYRNMILKMGLAET